jgi:tagaturonate reductase
MDTLPETVLQFGAGRFLRAFADLFIDQANGQGQAVGRVVVVQSTGDDRAAALTRQAGRYHVAVRGLAGGEAVDRVESVGSVSRALVAGTQWDDVRAVARSPALRVILSNTTEAGYDLDPADSAAGDPPRSFPAKLLDVMHERFRAGRPGVAVVPCELRENNADVLRGLVLGLAGRRGMGGDFARWADAECSWHRTLVDRIVAARPSDHPLAASDELLCAAEPYALWAVEERPGVAPFLRHPAVVWRPQVEPYFLRKVRILNGAHTALLVKAWPLGLRTVRDAVLDPGLGAWLARLLFEEVVPVVAGRCEDPEGFARLVLERFRNPFLEHRLADIARHHAAKVAVRLVPTRDEYERKFGRKPPLLQEVLEAPPPPV